MSSLDKEAFVASLSLESHPLLSDGCDVRAQYFYALTHVLTHLYEETSNFHKQRLSQYQEALLGQKESSSSPLLQAVTGCVLPSLPEKHYCTLLCDIALISQSKADIRAAADLVKKSLPEPQHSAVDAVVNGLLTNKNVDCSLFSHAMGLVRQYRENQTFLQEPERRILVTSNMSVGKSSLINAIVGKKVVNVSSGPTTCNVCYIHNKPFEDNRIHLDTGSMNLDASEHDLHVDDWSIAPKIASYFRTPEAVGEKVCVIDTPAFNTMTHIADTPIAENTLKNERYDMLIYVFYDHMISFYDEINSLKWISENIPHEKIIFVLNKLDEHRLDEGSISNKLSKASSALTKLGFKSPAVYPFSARFAYLAQLADHNELEDEDDVDEYELHLRRFKRRGYNLTSFYFKDGEHELGMEASKDAHIYSGLHGLASIVFGEG